MALILNLIRLIRWVSRLCLPFEWGGKNFGVISPFLLLLIDPGIHAISERVIGIRVSDHLLIDHAFGDR
jgi:hypothetical protein